jgi:hypothetical protein
MMIVPLITKGYGTISAFDVFEFGKEGCTEAEATKKTIDPVPLAMPLTTRLMGVQSETNHRG